MLPRLVAALHSAKLELTAEEIADALWLARYMQNAESLVASTTVLSENDVSSTVLSDSNVVEPIHSQQTPEQSLPTATLEPVSSDLYLFTTWNGSENGSQTGSSLRSPAALALPNALELGRALRPFKRRIPSRTAFMLNEEATAKQIARIDLWLPVLEAASTRWLEVALVVEESPSMVIWRQTIDELRLLLECEGAFRNLRTWGLVTDAADGKAHLYAGKGWGLTNRRECDPHELIDPRGQCMILVITDCVSRSWDKGWENGSVPHLLANWGRSNPVAIIQVLPQRLWIHTALNMAMPVDLRAPSPGASNTRLLSRIVHSWDADEVAVDLPVPIVTLEPQWLLPWARALARAEDVWIPGYMFNTSMAGLTENEEEQEQLPLSPQERVDEFRAMASPTAYRLAELLAAVPVSLPVIRLIQRTMLPESRQTHVAEVFLGGLLEEIPAEQTIVDPDYVEYDFIDGVRELLLDSLTVGESLEALSNYVENHFGQALDFRALIANPLAKEGVPIGKEARSFARVAAKVLYGLGGEFAPLVDWLEKTAGEVHAQEQLAGPSIGVEKIPEDILQEEVPQLRIDIEAARAAVVEAPGIDLHGAPAPLIEWVGRQVLLQTLNTDWSDPACHVSELIGFGGEGKSSLARHWLDRLLANPSLPQPDGVFWWNCYDQPSVDVLLEAALQYLSGGSIDPRRLTSSYVRAQVIGAMLGARRYLFILDGLEVLQHQEGDAYGLLINTDLRELLGYFAAPGHNSFCLFTSRAPLFDLLTYTTFRHHDVDRLSQEDGRDLLRKLGVHGPDGALDRLVANWDGHTLTLSLLGGYLVERYGGDVAHIQDLPAPIANEPRYDRVQRVLRRYDTHLSEAEHGFLLIFSAFRLPVPESALAPVFRKKIGRSKNALNAPIVALKDRDFEALLKRLRIYHLLTYDAQTQRYMTHPLIRAYYAARLDEYPNSHVQAVQARIKDYYLSSAGRESAVSSEKVLAGDKVADDFIETMAQKITNSGQSVEDVTENVGSGEAEEMIENDTIVGNILEVGFDERRDEKNRVRENESVASSRVVTTNPFNYGYPASSNKMVGRWDQVEAIARDLMNLDGHSHIVVGGRRFGKSSFLEALKYVLVRQTNQTRSGGWFFIPVLIDLQGLIKHSPEGVFGLFLNTLHMYFDPLYDQKTLGLHFNVELGKTRLHAYVQNRRRECPLDEFTEIMDEFLNIFDDSYGNLRIIFLIDEVEVGLGKDWTKTLFNQLRSLIHSGLLRNNIRFVIASSSQVIDARESGSPFLNMLNITYLEALEEKEMMKIIDLASEISVDIAKTVLEECGGHPFIAQYLMYYLWEYGSSKATQLTVSNLAHRFINERYADLKKWQLEIGTQGQLAYRILAEANGWLTIAQIRQLLNVPEFDIQRGLITLCYHGFAIRDATWSSYRVSGELFKRWFKSTTFQSSTNPIKTTIGASSSLARPKPSRTNAFISYSHKDKRYLQELQVHLAHYIRTENLSIWDDSMILPSANWRKEIEEALQSAKVVVLLISPNFLASDFIVYTELPLLLTAEHEGAIILPVILKSCAFKETELAQFQSVNDPSKPLSTMTPGKRAEVWSKVTELIRDALSKN